ncbi:MAG TPA: ArnT family glycosyltransferase [Candidatus Brocadiia bacterium]|nr:DUF2723 domain-containing protein [Candidatus Brocadiales bacterium]
MEYLKHKWSIPLILFFITIVSRLPFTSKMLYDLDSVQFALGTSEYNVAVHQPHPPGYIIYVMLGKLLNIITHDANVSFIIISILFSALTVVVIYYLGVLFFTKETGILSAILAITSPSIWFHGEVSLSYMPEAFFSVLTALLCWKILNGQHKYIYASAIVLALAGGVRQNTMVFLFPLWLFSIRNVPVRKILVSILLLIAIVAMWFIPMIILSGGLANYHTAANELWGRASGTRSIFKMGFQSVAFHLPYLIKFTFYGLGIGVIFLGIHLYSVIRKGAIVNLLDTKSIFFALWLIPSVLFYMFIFLHPANIGYSLIFIPGLIILLANSLTFFEKKVETQRSPRRICLRHDIASLRWIFTTLIIITNLLLFLKFPTYVSVPTIRTLEKNVQVVTSYIRANFSPEETVVLSGNLHYLGFRHAMYYLPDYKVFQTCPIGLYPDRGIFWGANHQTYFSPSINIPKGAKYCLIITHPVLLKEQITKIENTLFPKEIKLISLSDNLGVIRIDVNNAPKIYNDISFIFEG